MKLNKAIYLSAAGLSMMASAMLTSCNNEPEPVPAEEMFLRNFIMKYGLIDPEQDWNMATTTSLTLISDGVPRDVNVLVSCGGTLRRVGEFRNLKENIAIRDLDIPVFADGMYVESHGEMFKVELDGMLDLAEFSSPDASSPSYGQAASYEDMAWIIAAEDLGSTDDMDFNDIVFRIESVAVNFKGGLETTDWHVVDEDGWIDVSGTKSRQAASRDGDEDVKLVGKRLRITALASGGTLPLWLHYRANETYDYVIGYNDGGDNMLLASVLDADQAKKMEWHRWFGFDRDDIMINTGTPTEGISMPTGSGEARGIATVYVDKSFSVKEYCYVDYDGDNNGKKENWEWNTGDYTKYSIKGFYITVGAHTIENCQAALYPPHPGAAPQVFLIPDAGPDGTLWHWPTERTDISVVYPDFKSWVGGENSEWFGRYGDNAKAGYHYMRK